MGKYAPLKAFLIAQERDNVPMSFAEIEEMLELKLPASKRYPAWWSNNPSNNPMTKEWLAAGYETESVNTVDEKVVFRRVGRASVLRGEGYASPGFSEGQLIFKGELDMDDEEYVVPSPSEDPLFGCMAGTLTLLPDVDYTAPADPDWGKVYGD